MIERALLAASLLLVDVACAARCPVPAAPAVEVGGWWCDRRGGRSCDRDREACAYSAGSRDMMSMAVADALPPDRRGDPICEHRDVAYCFGGDGRGNSNYDTLDVAVCVATRAKCENGGTVCAEVR